jgi:hypothetical protein
LKELNDNFSIIISKVKNSYTRISQELKVQMHSEKGIDDFQEIISKSIKDFMEFSRQKAQNAQSREFVTLQPKESLQTLTKAKITITNYLGGQYFLTVDEIRLERENIYLIEGKHSNSGLLPSKGDVKDGLLKMILYTNLKNVEVSGIIYNSNPILLLTSTKLKSEIDSQASDSTKAGFFQQNGFNNTQQIFINTLFKEANTNGFLVILKKG